MPIHKTGIASDFEEIADLDLSGKRAHFTCARSRSTFPIPVAACKKDEGALVGIDSDSQSEMEFDTLQFGAGQGRRGRIEARDCLNTRSIIELNVWLEKDHKAVK